ncbi:hypothetical protein SVAN01_06608 [Stagonosporopsis vannaccii]|nr:hypothetical protein SVAN01_06608 [Stagonosporopsis vannaccii]
MPPRPFPISMRIGTDLCNIPRIRKLLTDDGTKKRNPHEAFLSKLLTYPERAYFRKRFGDDNTTHFNLNAAAQFLAGRFAAKEACRKACDHLDKDTRGFKHIIILPVDGLEHSEHQSRRPEALILLEALDETKESSADPFDVRSLEGQLCEISITHDGDFASAVALVPSMR